MKKLTIDQIEFLLHQMKSIQSQNPKLNVKVDLESGRIILEAPLSKDYFKILKMSNSASK